MDTLTFNNNPVNSRKKSIAQESAKYWGRTSLLYFGGITPMRLVFLEPL